MNFNYLIIVYTISCLLFLSISPMVRKNLLKYVIVLNLIFFSGMYYVTSEIVGLAKPLYISVPLYNTKSWPEKGLVLKTFFYNSDLLFVVLQADNDVPRMYSLPLDPKLIEEIKKAMKKEEAKGGEVRIKSDGKGKSKALGTSGSESHKGSRGYDGTYYEDSPNISVDDGGIPNNDIPKTEYYPGYSNPHEDYHAN